MLKYNYFCKYFFVKPDGMFMEPCCQKYKEYYDNCENCLHYDDRHTDKNFALELFKYVASR
jgi:hypothetical protein